MCLAEGRGRTSVGWCPGGGGGGGGGVGRAGVSPLCRKLSYLKMALHSR